jgi:hypothetical protein
MDGSFDFFPMLIGGVDVHYCSKITLFDFVGLGIGF